MEDIELIYHNLSGISFRWKNNLKASGRGEVQLVFRKMGFFLSCSEIGQFRDNIEAAEKKSFCSNCRDHKNCQSILIRSPFQKMEFAVSPKELEQLKDLIEGTLFKIGLQEFINGPGRN